MRCTFFIEVFMKHSQWLWALFSFFSVPHAGALAANLDCPDTITAQDLTRWRLEAAQQLEQGTMTDRSVAERIRTCFGSQVPLCLQRMNDYVSRNDTAPASMDTPLRSSPAKQAPVELFLNQAARFEYGVPEDIEERAAALGWPSVRYKSRHSGGFDRDTASLLMIYVPGDRVNPPVNYDRWLNFALPEDPISEASNPTPSSPIPSAEDYAAEARGEVSLPKVFTMVSLDRRQDDKPAQVYFQRFLRRTGNAVFKPEGNADPKRCVSCHPNGLRAISPLGYHVRKDENMMEEEAWKTVQLINAAMVKAAGQRPVSWREAPVSAGSTQTKALLNPGAFGPAIGPLLPLNGQSRTVEFINQCAQRRRTINLRDIFGRAPGRGNVYRLSSRPQIDPAKVLRFMNCAACHGSASRAPLNALTDWAQVDYKILVDQSMPLGAHKNPLESSSGEVQDTLNPDERIALANCLQAEFELEIQEKTRWLTQTQCQ
jgi:mono/diheme cytochrome c family protein